MNNVYHVLVWRVFLCYTHIHMQNRPGVLIWSAVHHEVFTAGALEGRVLSGRQLGGPSDVRWIMSSHGSGFVFIIHPN